jgi:lipoprotein-anchoring transpeptidase ErfK/SrfK
MRHGGRLIWVLIGGLCIAGALSAALLGTTMRERFKRDVMRMAFNGNLELLDDVKRGVGATRDTLDQRLVATSQVAPPGDRPYIVVSINDNRLWYREGDRTIFTARVATGSGKELVNEGPGTALHWKFETPRGRLVVQSKETDPVWVPPDWHYVEMARKKQLGLAKLPRGQKIPIGSGAVITVDGTDVVTRYPDGREVPFETKEGNEIVANGNVIIPPFGTNQRKYLGTLGVERLYLGDGYGLHGTDEPESIGQSASHGCVRLRNEDIETLYRIVPIGTVVYIY